MKKLILVGAGGHCRSVIDSIRSADEFFIEGILDLPERVGSFVDGVEVIGVDAQMKAYFNKGIKYAFLSLGSTGNICLRTHLYGQMLRSGFEIPSIVDATAVLARNVRMGRGVFVGKKAVVNAGTCIGEAAIVNTAAVIEHDCSVGDFAHIAPGAVLCGGVKVGFGSHIGAGSVIIQGVHIGKRSLIGAGAVVLSSIEAHSLAYGNPCKVAEKIEERKRRIGEKDE
ncbi:MAG: acetyltransferase [Peptostreptococcaceae bacterium]|nr:acetyltransferase [Peptostreptococcaceae bacterium]